MALLALDWAENKSEILGQFKLVFFLHLRYVTDDKSFEELILEQHRTLRMNNVTQEEIKSQLDDMENGQVLLLLDGYDEYRPNTNSQIDNIVMQPLHDTFVILSSRPGTQNLHEISAGMDKELHIEGFTLESVQKQAARYLEDEHTVSTFIQQAKKNKIENILKVPIMHAMACVVFKQKHALPESKTELVADIIYMSIDRTALKTLGCTGQDIDNLHDLLVRLGRLSWNALKRKGNQLLLKKVCISD